MQNELEQLPRIHGMVKELDRLVWSKNAFPQEHRPDVDFLIGNVEINSNPPLYLPPHPLIAQLKTSPIFDTLVEQGVALSHEDYEMSNEKKIAEYNPLTRVITLSEGAMTMSDRNIKRYLAHEMATDNHSRGIIIPQSEFTPYMKEQVELSFKQLRELGITTLEGEVEIIKTGSTQTLVVDRHAITTFTGELTSLFDEIYPTMFELITLAVADRNGDYRKLEKDIKQRTLSMSDDEQHRRFAETFYKAIEIIDWRTLLSIYKKPDYEEVLAQLKQRSSYGEGIFARLITDMAQDETDILTGLNILNQLGINNRTGRGK